MSESRIEQSHYHYGEIQQRELRSYRGTGFVQAEYHWNQLNKLYENTMQEQDSNAGAIIYELIRDAHSLMGRLWAKDNLPMPKQVWPTPTQTSDKPVRKLA